MVELRGPWAMVKSDRGQYSENSRATLLLSVWLGDVVAWEEMVEGPVRRTTLPFPSLRVLGVHTCMTPHMGMVPVPCRHE